MTKIAVYILSALLMSVCGSVAESAPLPNVNVGDIRVVTLEERASQGKADILIGATSEDLAGYVPGGTYPSAINAFLVRAADRVVVIDTGFGDKLFDILASEGVATKDVTDILLTHSHADHIGGLLRDGQPSFPRATVHISEAEYQWSAQAREMLAKYDSVKRFTPGDFSAAVEPVPGIAAVAAYGHTPGHTVFMIGQEGAKLLIWGDLVHAEAIQMPRPSVSVTYDSDPVKAAETRKAILEYVSREKVQVAGMHIANPGFGYVQADEGNPGGYIFKRF